MSALIATLFGIGHLRPAPGTWGSLAALPLAIGLYVLGGPWGVVVATVAVGIAGLWATRIETAGSADKDPGHIVIDEVVGQWIALWPIFFGAAGASVGLLALWPGWVAGFLLFRLFDIWKPGPIGWADRRGDAEGVMLDDILAGIAAAVCVTLLAGLWHGVLGR
ncbi:MAG: phosphatidylglycerophosphatase A [Rhodobacterales bacterium]|nr:phosphatidylglycerophosphatase A [Rhodobacterales bacterium]NCT12445.1 phosphatidylglycerophosphatase A [Rhodobacterales bacterium]